MLVCVLYFTVYVYVCVHCIQTNVCVPLYSTKGIDDVALNKKEISLSLIYDSTTTLSGHSNGSYVVT